MRKKKPISKVRIHLNQKSCMRKRLRRNRAKKKLRIRRATRIRLKNLRQRSLTQERYQMSLPMLTFSAPKNFSLLGFPEETISFVNVINEKVKEIHYKCQVSFDLSGVINADNEAIGLLLALVNSLSLHKVRSFGNLPYDNDALEIFTSSGFLEQVRSMRGSKSASKDSFIVQRGFSRTEPRLISREIRKIMFHLTGMATKYQPLYTLITEVISNSIEHANKNNSDKNWVLSVHYAENSVRIMIADIGIGIMATLRKRLRQSLVDTLTQKDDISILYNLFDRKYQSSTFEENRNQGLPKIKDMYDKNFISNLNVITNRVRLDFNNTSSVILTNNLQGTFFSLELNNQNILSWQQRTA